MAFLNDEIFDQEVSKLRDDFTERFNRSCVSSLHPLTREDQSDLEWHLSDLLWAAEGVADMFGKECLEDVLRHLLSSEDYWQQ